MKLFDANLLYVWPMNDKATEKENVTMRLSDCSGEFADPPSVGLPSRLTEAQIEKAREIAMHCQLSEFKGSN